jgi:transposase-like protein
LIGVARRHLFPNVEHRQGQYLNNHAENSHQPTRRQERQMQRFRSSGQAQRFLSTHAFIYGHFHPRRHQQPPFTARSGLMHSTSGVGRRACGTQNKCAQHGRAGLHVV